MQLAHGNDNLYPIQVSNAQWISLDRYDKHIFFLSTGKNSCDDIARLLRQEPSFVIGRACVLHVRGILCLKENERMLYSVSSIEQVVLLLDRFKTLCVKVFYDFLQKGNPKISVYVAVVSENQLESEFFTMLHFLSRIATTPGEQIYALFLSIIDGYRLRKLSDIEIEILISSLMQAISHCLLDSFTPEIEKSWRNFCFILKHAIFALCK